MASGAVLCDAPSSSSSLTAPPPVRLWLLLGLVSFSSSPSSRSIRASLVAMIATYMRITAVNTRYAPAT
jgi:hypothetical protein